MIQGEITLYFGSLTPGDGAVLVWNWLISLVGGCRRARRRFEERVAAQLGASTVRLYGSARGALAACLRAGGVQRGDEVVVAGFTCLAVPTAVLATGATPVYADIDARSLTTPFDAIHAKIGPRTRAVILQHTFGNLIDPAVGIALRKAGLLVIEDWALATGSRTDRVVEGNGAHAAVFSLELSKTISTGWGGVLAVYDCELADTAAAAYEHVLEPAPGRVCRMVWQTAISAILYRPLMYPWGKYVLAIAFRLGLFKPSTADGEYRGRLEPGFVARLSAPQAALGDRLWRRLPQVRDDIAPRLARLRQLLRTCGFVPLAEPDAHTIAVTNRVPFAVRDRESATRWFAGAGIELGRWFDAPVSPPPPPDSPLASAAPDCPIAAQVSAHIVNLPAHQRLTARDVERIERVLRAYVAACPDAAMTPEAGGMPAA